MADPRLPFELLDRIVKDASEASASNAAALRVVCRGWASITEEVLFRNIYLTSTARIAKFVDHVAPHPHLLRHIRSIAIDVLEVDVSRDACSSPSELELEVEEGTNETWKKLICLLSDLQTNHQLESLALSKYAARFLATDINCPRPRWPEGSGVDEDEIRNANQLEDWQSINTTEDDDGNSIHKLHPDPPSIHLDRGKILLKRLALTGSDLNTTHAFDFAGAQEVTFYSCACAFGLSRVAYHPAREAVSSSFGVPNPLGWQHHPASGRRRIVFAIGSLPKDGIKGLLTNLAVDLFSQSYLQMKISKKKPELVLRLRKGLVSLETVRTLLHRAGAMLPEMRIEEWDAQGGSQVELEHREWKSGRWLQDDAPFREEQQELLEEGPFCTCAGPKVDDQGGQDAHDDADDEEDFDSDDDVGPTATEQRDALVKTLEEKWANAGV